MDPLLLEALRFGVAILAGGIVAVISVVLTYRYAERRTGLGGGSNAEWATVAGYSGRGAVASENAAGPISEGDVSATA